MTLDAHQWGTPVRVCESADDVYEIARSVRARRAALRPLPTPKTAAVLPMPSTVVLEATTPREAQFRDWLNLAPATSLKRPKWRDILNVVVASTGVTANELIGDRRMARITKPRMMLFWLLRRHSMMSLPQIGLRLGGKDHTTVLHGCRRVEAWMASDPDFRGLMTCLSDEIMARAE